MNQQQAWRNCPKMTHEEWLAWRRSGVGSSDAAAIMGVSPYKTAFQSWEEKVFSREQQDNRAMQMGREQEEPARRQFESLMNTCVFAANVENSSQSWRRASLDGIDPDGNILVEIKFANKEDHLAASGKRIPEKYYPQCQHQLAVTGLPGMYYFSFDGTRGIVVEVQRDDKYIADMLSKEKDFWDMVVNEQPPALTDRDFASMEDSKEWKALTNKWKETNKMLKDLTNVELDLREQLIALSKDRSAKGNNISLSKSVCKGSIDYKTAIQEYLDNMRAHHPEVNFPDVVLEPYRKKPFTKWTVRAI